MLLITKRELQCLLNCNNTFKIIKAPFNNTINILYLNFTKTFITDCDASDSDINGVEWDKSQVKSRTTCVIL